MQPNHDLTHQDTALVVIAKAPERGKVKTRLVPGLGEDGALAAYQQLLGLTESVCQAWPGPVALFHCGAESAWREWHEKVHEQGTGFFANCPQREQPDGDLGQRIAAALHFGLELSPRAIAIGTDCPDLSIAALSSVSSGLNEHEVCFGPATDGGYWAIGVASARATPVTCASDLPWSQPNLLQTTQHCLNSADISYDVGFQLADCDTATDYTRAVQAGRLQPIQVDASSAS